MHSVIIGNLIYTICLANTLILKETALLQTTTVEVGIVH